MLGTNRNYTRSSVWGWPAALTILFLVACVPSKRVNDNSFYNAAYLEIESCLKHGRDCGRKTDLGNPPIPLRDMSGECFDNIRQMTMRIEGTTAELTVTCVLEKRLLKIVASGDRQLAAGRITGPVATISWAPDQI